MVPELIDSTTGRPNWDAVTEEIRCPLCGYSLRGLDEARCPECGYAFHWLDLVDPSRRLHPYLFEHHPERNLWSFRRTLLAGRRPGRFWSDLHPAQPSRSGRIVLYWLLTSLVFFVLVQATAVGAFAGVLRMSLASNVTIQRMYQTGQLQLRQYEWAGYDSIQAYLDDRVPVRLSRPFVWDQLKMLWPDAKWFPVAPLLLLGWPWVTFGGLMVFQWSMRRARVRASHVLRCAIYSGDVLVWFALAGGIVAVTGLHVWLSTGGGWSVSAVGLFLMLLIATPLVYTYRLVVAYRRYLKFDHAVATVLTSQVIAGLCLLIVVMRIAYG